MSTAYNSITSYHVKVLLVCAHSSINDCNIFYSMCAFYSCGHKRKVNREKGAMTRDSSLLHGKRVSGKKSWKASPESKPLLLDSHSQGDKEDGSEFSDYVNSDSSLD